MAKWKCIACHARSDDGVEFHHYAGTTKCSNCGDYNCEEITPDPIIPAKVWAIFVYEGVPEFNDKPWSILTDIEAHKNKVVANWQSVDVKVEVIEYNRA